MRIDGDERHAPPAFQISSFASAMNSHHDHGHDDTPMASSSPFLSPDNPPREATNIESPIESFSSFAEYFNTLEGQDGIVVVLYAASFCKLCQRATMVYKQIASKRRQVDPRLKFYRLEVSTSDGSFMKPLQISKFPYVQIFYRQNCVASFSTGPSHQFRKKVEDTLDDCMRRTEEDWATVQELFGKEIQENRSVRRNLMQSLLRP
jgi:hypothetical protein